METVGVPARAEGVTGRRGADAGTPAGRRREGGMGTPAPGLARGMVAAEPVG